MRSVTFLADIAVKVFRGRELLFQQSGQGFSDSNGAMMSAGTADADPQLLFITAMELSGMKDDNLQQVLQTLLPGIIL